MVSNPNIKSQCWVNYFELLFLSLGSSEWHKMTQSDSEWHKMFGKEKGTKEDKLVLRETWDFCPIMLSHYFFLSQLSISKFLFWDISVTNYKTLFFYSICLRFLNPVLNPISAICDENIILDSPIGYWNNDFKGRCKTIALLKWKLTDVNIQIVWIYFQRANGKFSNFVNSKR